MYTLIFSSALGEMLNNDKDGFVKHNIKIAKILAISLFAIRANQIMRRIRTDEQDNGANIQMNNLVKEFMDTLTTMNAYLRAAHGRWEHSRGEGAKRDFWTLFRTEAAENLINNINEFYRTKKGFEIVPFMDEYMKETLKSATKERGT